MAIVFEFVWLAANLFDDRGGLPKQTEASGCSVGTQPRLEGIPVQKRSTEI